MNKSRKFWPKIVPNCGEDLPILTNYPWSSPDFEGKTLQFLAKIALFFLSRSSLVLITQQVLGERSTT